MPLSPACAGKRSLLALADALVNRADLCNPQEVSNSGAWLQCLRVYCHDLGLLAATVVRRAFSACDTLLAPPVSSRCQTDPCLWRVP